MSTDNTGYKMLASVEHAVRRAGQIILVNWDRPKTIKHKGRVGQFAPERPYALGADSIAASNSRIHPKMLELLQDATRR